MLRRLASIAVLSMCVLAVSSGAAFACGGLVAPGHAEVLEKATTLAAWHGGFEHYITGFRFTGSASSFGYIVPSPAVPSRIQKGGDWTLERLEREVTPVTFEALAASAAVPRAAVQVLQQVRIEALDITVVRGGGADVATWAGRSGFPLTPDAPHVLGSYRSGIFALAKFDRTEAAKRGVIEGQGETIHFTIPTAGPWIPLRILALGKAGVERVNADLFVLTDSKPDTAPAFKAMPGMTVVRSTWASKLLLHDLRSDRGMSWVPRRMWFTALRLDAPATLVRYDLAADGARLDGLFGTSLTGTTGADTSWWSIALATGMAGVVLALCGGLVLRRRPQRGMA
jgi:hypothetical protein